MIATFNNLLGLDTTTSIGVTLPGLAENVAIW